MPLGEVCASYGDPETTATVQAQVSELVVRHLGLGSAVMRWMSGLCA